MLPIVGIDHIKARAEAINLSLKDLARKAGVDPTTAYKGAKGETDTRRSTLNKLLGALERQEDKVRRHLREVERSGGGRQMEIFNSGGKA